MGGFQFDVDLARARSLAQRDGGCRGNIAHGDFAKFAADTFVDCLAASPVWQRQALAFSSAVDFLPENDGAVLIRGVVVLHDAHLRLKRYVGLNLKQRKRLRT